MDVQDYATEYRAKTDDELLRIALAPGDLVPEANLGLSAELNARGLKAEDVEAFREEEQRIAREEAKDPVHLSLMPPYGIGRARFGKANYERLPNSKRERFKTTIFLVLFWIPLIPTGTYRIEKGRGLFSGSRFTILEKLPLDWEQILKVWVVAATSLLVIIWAFKLLPFLLWRYRQQ